MTERHKVFVSYYHDEDQAYRTSFERICQDVIVSKSVNDGDIDPNANTEYVRQLIRDRYLADSTVTVVLIGAHTWQRKHVDWEISSSIRDTRNNPRSGLLGILLPTYPLFGQRKYDPHTIPPRIYDNLVKKNNDEPFADIYLWTESALDIQNWVHKAFQKRDKVIPDNSRPMYGKNHSGDSWTD